MTEEQFRSDREMRSELVKAVENSALLQAMAIIKAKYEGLDVPETASEIASVRRLSARTAVDNAFADLFRFTKPVPKAPEEPPTNFGTEFNAEDFDALNPQKR